MEAKNIIENWPKDSKEAAKLVIDKYVEPNEATESLLIWHKPGPWKRMIAYRDFDRHDFPAPHIDAVESFLSYRVPPALISDLVLFDGSVVVNRTRGEISARCHDEQANFLALNLANDIINGEKTVEDAREYYKKEFLDFRRKAPTPYMDGLQFEPKEDGDPDTALITDEELKKAKEEGSNK